MFDCSKIGFPFMFFVCEMLCPLLKSCKNVVDVFRIWWIWILKPGVELNPSTVFKVHQHNISWYLIKWPAIACKKIWTAWSLLSGLKCRGEDEFSQLWWLCACVCLGILFLANKWPTLTDYGYFESKNLSQIFLSQVYYEFFDLFFAKIHLQPSLTRRSW